MKCKYRLNILQPFILPVDIQTRRDHFLPVEDDNCPSKKTGRRVASYKSLKRTLREKICRFRIRALKRVLKLCDDFVDLWFIAVMLQLWIDPGPEDKENALVCRPQNTLHVRHNYEMKRYDVKRNSKI